MQHSASYEALYRDYQNANAWGLHSAIDLHGCNPDKIRSADEIKRFVVELCDRIEMKRFGECTVVNFGEDERVAGFSMFQLIETSCISAHFANATNSTYLDVFSCKFYDPEEVAKFAMEFFESDERAVHSQLRI